MDSQLTARDSTAPAAGDDQQISRRLSAILLNRSTTLRPSLPTGETNGAGLSPATPCPPAREAYTVAVSWAGARDSAPSQ